MGIGQNLKTLKSTNRSALLYLLNKNGQMSRKEIAKSLKLTPAAVTKISQELIHEGYVNEGAAIKDGQKGRSEVMLSLNLAQKFIVGICADRDSISYSISSLDGNLVLLDKKPFDSNVDNVVLCAKEFLVSSGYKGKIMGAGVCIIGSIHGYGIWEIKNLKEKFEKALGVEVVIHNNVRSFAIAGTIYEVKDNKKAELYFKWGPGIGSAIVNDGQVLNAGDSGVSEIGHYIVNPNGKKCRCGRVGCLETEATLDNNNIYDKIKLAAMALMNTATILNADSIVLFGSVFSNGEIAENFIDECLKINPYLKKEDIQVSKLNDKVAYIGATAICARRLFFERK